MVAVATLGTVAVFVKTLGSGGTHYNLKKKVFRLMLERALL